MRLQLVVRSYERMIGIARYTVSLCEAMDKLGIAYSLVWPTYPWPVRATHKLLSRLGFDVKTFFTTYPLAAPLDAGALVHLTAQQMATMLWSDLDLHATVVTVHDIVPFLVRHDKSQRVFRHPLEAFFDLLAVSGLKRADVLISDSQFTKETITKTLKCSSDSVYVVHLGVDHELFHFQPPPDDFYARYQLDRDLRYVLYVGSENPRKNLPRLIDAFAWLHEAMPDIRFVKVGAWEFPRRAEQLRTHIRQAGVEDATLLYERVPDADLALFYSAADLFVFPSLYEGFGLPPLEAMACGAPVVCSNTSSLPEVVGDAALTVDPYDVEALAEAMRRVLTDPDLRKDLRARGLERAKQFTWERTARETLAVYREVSG